MKRQGSGRFTHHQRGQSLVEVCVACIALVPLAIGLVYIGQYIHMKQTVQMAAREAAWDAALAPSTFRVEDPDGGAEQTRLQARYFGDAGTPITTVPQAPASYSDAMLLDYAGHKLLAPDQLTLSQYSNEKTPGAEGAITEIVGKLTGFLSKIGISGGKFPPDPKGYITARVDAHAAKSANFSPLDTLDLHFHAQTALLADAWNADGSGEIDGDDSSKLDNGGAPIPERTVLNAMPPSAALLNGGISQGIAKVFNFIAKIPIVNTLFPTDGFNVGRAAPDVIPYDKLKPYEP